MSQNTKALIHRVGDNMRPTVRVPVSTMLALKPVLAKNNIRIGDFLSSVLESAIAEYLETQGVADIPRPLQGVPLARKPNPRSKKLSLAD